MKFEEFKKKYDSLNEKDQWKFIFDNKDIVDYIHYETPEFTNQTISIHLKDGKTRLVPKSSDKLEVLFNYLGFNVETY